jgi:hypothetical protein
VKERPDPGKKMMKIGAALILMPEPVTSAAGVPMVILGKAISSNRGTTLSGVYEEMRRELDEIGANESN